jgi:long-chain acyl-CoA synthetase
VKAFIVLKPGVEWDEERLQAHCEEHLSKYKRPRIFERCVGDLPRNFLGKVIRRELREEAPATTNVAEESLEVNET